jgi:hypothetical protein
MNKIALTSIIGGGLIAAVVGFAAPAQADLGHNTWANNPSTAKVYVPQVDTTVHQSR